LLQNGVLHFVIRLSQSSEIALESKNLRRRKNWVFWKGLGT